MIDDFDGDAAGFGLGERARDGAVQGFPRFLVNLRTQTGFERLIRIVLAEKIGVAHEETFLVVIRVNEPARDALGLQWGRARAGAEI